MYDEDLVEEFNKLELEMQRLRDSTDRIWAALVDHMRRCAIVFEELSHIPE